MSQDDGDRDEPRAEIPHRARASEGPTFLYCFPTLGSGQKQLTLAFSHCSPVTGAAARQESVTNGAYAHLRRARTSSMNPRIIPVILASAGFLVTFTIRSWQEGVWFLDKSTDYAMVSSARPPATAHRMTTPASPFASAQPLAPALIPQATRPHEAAATPPVSAPTPVNAQHYLSERAGGEGHSSRTR